MLEQKNDTLYVINFWATWCKPCVEELPAFEKLNREEPGNVCVWLVNLDFNSQMKSKVPEFLEKHSLRSKLFHITDTDPNEWIDRIDSSWSGAIPATVFFRNGRKAGFHEGSFSETELRSAVQQILKSKSISK